MYLGRAQLFPSTEMKRRPFQQRHLWTSIILALIPFLIFRLVVFYEVTFPIGSYVVFPGILKNDQIQSRSYSASNVRGSDLAGTDVGLAAWRERENAGSEKGTWVADEDFISHVPDRSGRTSQALKQNEEEESTQQDSEEIIQTSPDLDNFVLRGDDSVAEVTRKTRDTKEFSLIVNEADLERRSIEDTTNGTKELEKKEDLEERERAEGEEEERHKKVQQERIREEEERQRTEEVERKRKEENEREQREEEECKFKEEEERKLKEEEERKLKEEEERKLKEEEERKLKEEEERQLKEEEKRKLKEEEKRKLKEEEERKLKEEEERKLKEEEERRLKEKEELKIQDEEKRTEEQSKRVSESELTTKVAADAQSWNDGKEEQNKVEPVEGETKETEAPEHNSDESKKNGDEQVQTDNQVDSKDDKQGNSQPAEAVISPEERLNQLWNTRPGDCNLHDGVWEYDEADPLYTNETCAYIQGDQDCIANERPDTMYLHWRWKPRDCDLPRFDAEAFMKAFKGKSIGFVGDSLARNQMQSLLCMLAQVETPIKVYDYDANVKWHYEKYDVTLLVVWSPYLLKHTYDPVEGYNLSSVLYLDVLDTVWTSKIQELDIIVLSLGQWYFKSSVYIRNDEVVGCHYCPQLNLTELGFYEIYREGLRRILDKVAAEMKGIVIMSTFAIQHFENGPWESGGDCRREKPAELEEMPVFGGMHEEMRAVVLDEFTRTLETRSQGDNDLYFDFLDVTRVSLLRADGHPGPYRRPHPYAHRDPSEWVQNDCLHWCLPGPVDTWNQLLVKIAHRYL